MSKLIYLLSLSFFFLISVILQIVEGTIIFSAATYALFYLIVGLAALMPLLEYVFSKKLVILRFYPISIFILAMILSILLDFAYFPGLIFQAIALVFAIRYIVDFDSLKKYHLAYVFYGFMMLALSSLLREIPYQNISQVLVFNIGDDINVAGVPFFFSNGVVVAGMRYFVFSFSFQYMAIILILGFLLLENARGVINIARIRKSGNSSAVNLVSMSFSVFSCQCETITSIIPAIGAEILGIISLPVILESLALSIGTFAYLHFLRNGKYGIFGKLWNSKRQGKAILALSISAMAISPILVTVGVFFGFQKNLLFYFGTNLGLFAASAIVFTRLFYEIRLNIKLSRMLYIVFSIITTFLMVAWYFPALLEITINNGVAFSIMGIDSIISGLILSFMLIPVDKLKRSIIYEYIVGMFPVVFVVILYYTVITSSQIWPAFSISTQLIFALILLGISLPVMWISTNYSIYGNYASNR